MTTNELRVLKTIWEWGGEASIDVIARENNISLDYVRLICESLGREDYINFLHSKLCKIKSKGKLVMANGKGQFAKKIVIGDRPTKFGLRKDKKSIYYG